jgi:ABC-type transporter MlaC component
LQRDQAGVKKFRKLFDSILVNKIFGKLNEAQGAKFTVYNNVRARNANTYEVPTTMTRKGQSLNATIVVYNSSGKWRMIDGKAYGYSGVAYLKKDIQKKLKASYDRDPNNSLPVTDYVNAETSGGGFTTCR